MLHGIREGAVGTDVDGRVTLLNDEAQRLLRLEPDTIGRPLEDLVASGRVRDVLVGKVDGPDQVILVGDRVLVANRMPVSVRGREIGAVVTLRDRTELEGLLRELDDVRSLAEALRAQEHDFSHRLHVISGLIELGRHEDAVQFIAQSSHLHQELATSLVASFGDHVLVALLLGKAAIASERGVELRVSVDERLPDLGDVRDLVTVIGNLVDNALDSVAATENGAGWIEVTIAPDETGLAVRVHDTGPGIPAELIDEIFRDGFTTKVARGAQRRGLGLALVSQTARRRGGYVTVENDRGALFPAYLPFARDAEPSPA